jgi:signal peptidase I
MAVNDNPRSPYYGRVFGGNKSGGNCGVRKMNNDLSDADEGALGTCGGFNWHNDGNAPWGLKYAANDQLYFEDWENNGDIYVTDNTCSTNKSVLNNNSSSGNFDDFEVMIIGNGGYIIMGDFNYPGIGVYAWPIVNGVASGSGTQIIAPNSTAMLIGDGGLCMDMNTNIYVGQMRTGTDNNPRVFLAGSGPWNGSTKITAAPRWGNGNSDGNTDNNYPIAINSRTNPTYVAMAIGGIAGYQAGIRVLNAANGTVVTTNGGAQVLTNLDSGRAYWGVAFDAVGNLYGCESGTAHVRGFSPPGVSTNTTFAYAHVNVVDAGPTITQQPQPSNLTPPASRTP